MWLIDGSKLKATYLNGRYGFDCLEVLRAPTVNAIPVEWIENYTRRNFPLENGEIVLGFMADMLEDWEKENEH